MMGFHAFVLIATTLFAKQTMLSCDACHTATMALTPLGRGFRNSNFRMVRLTRSGAPAVALRGQFAYTSQPDDSGLPKLILDEVDYFVAGQIADNFTYFSDVYAVDGGRNGLTREAWIEYSSPRQRSPQAYRVTAGLITLPVPLEPESFRETNEHFAIWDQAVGANPFTFFDPHYALSAGFGNQVRGLSASLLAVSGTDPQSGIPSSGLDRMTAVQDVSGPLVLAAYRYDGKRVTGATLDNFWRTGFGASLYAGRFSVNAVTQSGFDSSPNGDGAAASSGGGFLQARYQLTNTAFAIARYDGAEDGLGNFSRTLTVGAGTRVGRNFRFELEDVIGHAPATTHTLNAVFAFGFSNAGGSQAY
jgi:hypothetical protein